MENIDKILIVDNEEHHLRSLLQTLEGESREILFTQTAKEAMGIIHKNKVDLVIATYGMPEMSGLELVKNIRELKPEITRILLSDTTDIEVMIKALNRGDVFNFLVEPCEKNLTRDIVEKGLKQRLRIMERRKSEHLQLEKVTLETAMSLAESIERKDPYTEGHCGRIRDYSLRIARKYGLSKDSMYHLIFSSLLHDIGKIRISKEVLLFQGPLNREQRKAIVEHPIQGFEITNRMEHLKPTSLIIRHHHERWDGRGYPDKLKGHQIPICSRIISIADAYDAMTSDRPYRVALEKEKAKRILFENRGGQFDPELVDIFIDILDTEKEIGDEDEIKHQCPPKILLVSKEPQEFRSVTRCFFNKGYTIINAKSSHRALEVLRENEIDLIISDFVIPEMTGVMFLNKCKITHPKSVRIMISEDTLLHDLFADINDAGLYKLILKPWDEEEFKKAIQEALQWKFTYTDTFSGQEKAVGM